MRLFLAPALLVLLQIAPHIVHGQRPEAIAGDLLVMLTPDGSVQRVAEDLERSNGLSNGLKVVREVSRPMRTWLLRFDTARADQAVMLRAVRNHPHVLLAQNNHRTELRAIPNDTEYGDQWHHANIDSEGAWDISTGGLTADGDTIVVCIIENCDMPHPDLIGNAWFNHAEVPGNGVDDDDNGYIDDFRGWNPNAENDQVYGGSHGTEVAGMIGAMGNNAEGVVGANWAVKMMVVFNSGASDEGVIASHSYPLTMRRLYNESNGTRGAFVVATNASWGINGGQPDDAPLWCAMYDSLGAEGVLNCGATANNNVDVDEVGDLPTACPSDFMISVTATNADDERTFSAYGLNTIDVGAPGSNVLTTEIGGGYGTTSGTSFASPLTAGVIGLLYSAPCAGMMTLVKGDPAAGALFVRQKLFEGVDQVGNLPGNTVTGGRINAGTSMELIMASCGSCPAPYNVSVQAVDLNTTTVSWNAISGSTFDLRYRAVGAPDWNEVNDLMGPGYELNGLDPCTPHELQVRVDCADETSEYSNLLTWTSEGCCTAPDGLVQVSVEDALVNVSWTPLLAADTYDIRYAPLSSSDFTIVEGVTNDFLAIAPLDACTNYTVQVRTRCGDVTTDWCAPITVATTGCGACTDNAYCANDGGNSNGEWIALVQLGTIDNASGNDNGYGDYTTNTTDLMVGTSHTIVLEPGFGGFAFSEWFRVWVDLDHDGEFTTTTELVFDSEDSSNDPVEGALFIPWDAALGATRLRVAMRYNVAPASACADFDYGEVEDYCVTLVANASVGIQDVPGTDVGSLYPQPADQQLFIRSPETALDRPLSMDVYDGTGRMVAHQVLQGTPALFSTAQLANGVYTYRLLSAGSLFGQGRFMVTHTR